MKCLLIAPTLGELIKTKDFFARKNESFLRNILQSNCVYLNELLTVCLCCRCMLEEQEHEIENLELKLEKILKLATASCDSGRQFVVNQR